MIPSVHETTGSSVLRDDEQHGKKRKLHNAMIQNFFARRENSNDDPEDLSEALDHAEDPMYEPSSPHMEKAVQGESKNTDETFVARQDRMSSKTKVDISINGEDAKGASSHQFSLNYFFCQGCSKSLPAEAKGEHEDWHFARNLQAKDHGTPLSDPRSESHRKVVGVKKSGSTRPSQGLRTEKGQSRLAFGT